MTCNRCDVMKIFCRNKTFVVTNICCDKHNFVATIFLTWQAFFCHDKRRISCDKMMFVATNICCNKHVCCCDKSFVTTSIFLSWQNKSFVLTKLLLQQKWYLWQLPPMIVYMVRLLGHRLNVSTFSQCAAHQHHVISMTMTMIILTDVETWASGLFIGSFT